MFRLADSPIIAVRTRYSAVVMDAMGFRSIFICMTSFLRLGSISRAAGRILVGCETVGQRMSFHGRNLQAIGVDEFVSMDANLLDRIDDMIHALPRVKEQVLTEP